MPRVPAFIEHRGVEPTKKSLENSWQSLRKTYERTAVVLNGNVSFGTAPEGETPDRDNIDGVWVAVPDTGVGDTDFTITHNLGRIPVGYILMRSDRATMIYDGSVAATDTEITLRSATDNASVKLFII